MTWDNNSPRTELYKKTTLTSSGTSYVAASQVRTRTSPQRSLRRARCRLERAISLSLGTTSIPMMRRNGCSAAATSTRPLPEP